MLSSWLLVTQIRTEFGLSANGCTTGGSGCLGVLFICRCGLLFVVRIPLTINACEDKEPSWGKWTITNYHITDSGALGLLLTPKLACCHSDGKKKSPTSIRKQRLRRFRLKMCGHGLLDNTLELSYKSLHQKTYIGFLTDVPNIKTSLTKSALKKMAKKVSNLLLLGILFVEFLR